MVAYNNMEVIIKMMILSTLAIYLGEVIDALARTLMLVYIQLLLMWNLSNSAWQPQLSLIHMIHTGFGDSDPFS